MSDQPATYLINGLEYSRVTNVLKDLGIIDVRWFAEFAAVRGTLVHDATALFDRKDLDMKSVDPQIEGYVRAWIRFRMENRDLEIVESEKRVYCPKIRVAGRLDTLAKQTGRILIIDKKAATTLNPAVEIQTAAYECLYREMTGFKGPIKRKAVQLFPDGTFKAKCLNDPNDLNVWISAVNVYNWKRKRR